MKIPWKRWTESEKCNAEPIADPKAGDAFTKTKGQAGVCSVRPVFIEEWYRWRTAQKAGSPQSKQQLLKLFGGNA